ncbi:hypothetical protein CAMRE0001_0616 [Campylobacter rectus RM3267]|uniref:Uncharacterized protein n=1 Tax=Campylobacter rectus RM3267 TaxID=553218 RepID=B9D1F7_CAMRE|nr:hypothetical protein CAMRE0001_0616 [Campylobacter rectus RM3267]
MFKFTVFGEFFAASLVREIWRFFCVVISRELLTELVKNRLGGLACPACSYFSLRNSQNLSKI